MKIVYNPNVLTYNTVGHPETSRRAHLIYDELKKDKRLVFTREEKILEKELLLAHNKTLIDSVKKNNFDDPDTPNISNAYSIAMLSVSCAVTASIIAQEEGSAFSLSRPPGHHAARNRLGGFCYFNNIAIAALITARTGKRVAILDIDVHHGNGTEDIVNGNKNILFCSLHQSPLYPGTGLVSHDNCINFPLPPGTTYQSYKPYLKQTLQKIKEFKPYVLGVSAGFDTYKQDPLAQFLFEESDYATIGKEIKSLRLPTFFVLEGGYSEQIGYCCTNLLQGFL